MHTFEATRTEPGTEIDQRVPHHADNMYFAWLFMHSPEQGWEFCPLLDDKGKRVESNGAVVWEVLPSLRRFKIKPGVRGVQTGKAQGDGPIWTGAKARLEGDGWLFIPHNAIAAAKGKRGIVAFGAKVPGGYLVRYDGKRGTIYADAWSRPVSVPGGKIVWEYDQAGFNAFRRDLVKRGIIPAPTERAINVLIRRQEHRARRRIQDVHIPAVAEVVNMEALKLEAMRNILAVAQESHAADAPRGPVNPMAVAAAAAAEASEDDES